jgi:hypothetical protein
MIAEDAVQLELDPPQPPAVVAALANVLAADAPTADPWWQAGLEESLEP